MPNRKPTQEEIDAMHEESVAQWHKFIDESLQGMTLQEQRDHLYKTAEYFAILTQSMMPFIPMEIKQIMLLGIGLKKSGMPTERAEAVMTEMLDEVLGGK